MSKGFERAFLLGGAGCLLLAGQIAQAQGIRVRGQIFLPNGQPIGAVTRILLNSEDPRRETEIHFSDSQGRFHLQGLAANRWYKITVETDGETYATTEEPFLAAGTTYVPVHLRRLSEPKPNPALPSVSVKELSHQPPREARKAYEQALAAIEQRQFELAKQRLRHAIEVDPSYVNPYNELGVLAMGEKNYGEAESLLRRALEKDPVALHPLLNLGITLNHLARYKEAIEPLRSALKLRPQWLSPQAYLGIALLETDQLAEAEPYLQRATRAEGREQALAYLYLGKLYAQRGEADKAIAAWQSYLEKDPESPNATRVRSLLEQLRHPTQKP